MIFNSWKSKEKQPTVPARSENGKPAEIIKAEERLDRKKVGTVIADGTEIVGNINTKLGIIVSGNFKGELRATGENVPIIIKPSGVVNGEIIGDLVFVYGTVEANITAETLVIYSCAKFHGNIVAKNFSVEHGASLLIESCISDGHAKIELPPRVQETTGVTGISAFRKDASNAA